MLCVPNLNENTCAEGETYLDNKCVELCHGNLKDCACCDTGSQQFEKCKNNQICPNNARISSIDGCAEYGENQECVKCEPGLYVDNNVCNKCVLEGCQECTAVGCTKFKPAADICMVMGGVWVNNGCVPCLRGCRTCGLDLKCNSCHNEEKLKNGECVLEDKWATTTLALAVLVGVVTVVAIGYIAYVYIEDCSFNKKQAKVRSTK